MLAVRSHGPRLRIDHDIVIVDAGLWSPEELRKDVHSLFRSANIIIQALQREHLKSNTFERIEKYWNVNIGRNTFAQKYQNA